MTDEMDVGRVSRRTLLRASGGALAVSAVGTGQTAAASDASTRAGAAAFERCPDATLRPSMGYCAGASTVGCDDDHPVTQELQAAVRETLTERYDDVGALIDAGFKPYFDTLDVADEDGWSHWLNPEYIGDDTVLDPERPESVLVDNTSWRSIGVMFIATRNGEPVDPPAVYDNDEAVWDERNERRAENEDHDYEYGHDDGDSDSGGNGGHGHGNGHNDHDYNGPDHEDEHNHDHGPIGHEDRCSPWHYHAGLPGRFAWWYYRQAYEQDFSDGDLEIPCRTPCMMHVWTVDHPDGVYAHGGPPADARERTPADEAGFETNAEPGTDELDWDILPDELVPDERPDELTIPGVRK
ncbi:hypothetical protein [Natronolimnobius baerhuensis]|uniref:Uncharacterized protein n=1 Tax=Natronolimnobius baerhuensis TaxID=253108 RepID=A0A202E626_9EURY|nr:hypothetical protein [Natronolimnobius baerhuensis]OVE83726.1 hypothetical protein B2G88_14990 [Natronolimnobius baerhuensis]